MTAGLASLQVAAYGGKLRYTLSYTAGAQGSPLSDPDVQITVSRWLPARRAGGEGGSQQAACPYPVGPGLGWPGTRWGSKAPEPHPVGLDTTQAEAQLLGERGSEHVPDSFGHMSLGDHRPEVGVTERPALVEDTSVPGSPSIPLPMLLLSLQGNNIMLVASQPALQGPERKSFEIIFREVRPHGLPPALEPGFDSSAPSLSPILPSQSSTSGWRPGVGVGVLQD